MKKEEWSSGGGDDVVVVSGAISQISTNKMWDRERERKRERERERERERDFQEISNTCQVRRRAAHHHVHLKNWHQWG